MTETILNAIFNRCVRHVDVDVFLST